VSRVTRVESVGYQRVCESGDRGVVSRVAKPLPGGQIGQRQAAEIIMRVYDCFFIFLGVILGLADIPRKKNHTITLRYVPILFLYPIL
jgi:hypothetical protein